MIGERENERERWPLHAAAERVDQVVQHRDEQLAHRPLAEHHGLLVDHVAELEEAVDDGAEELAHQADISVEAGR